MFVSVFNLGDLFCIRLSANGVDQKGCPARQLGSVWNLRLWMLEVVVVGVESHNGFFYFMIADANRRRAR